MAKIQIDGFAELERQLNASYDQIHKINKSGLYDGAEVIADAVHAEIDNIPSNCLLNERERDDLKQGLFVSKHKDTKDGVETYVSFAGYNNWTDGPSGSTGDPIILIARSVSKGSSLRKGKYKFTDKATRNNRKKAEEAIADKIDKEIEKLFK